MARRVKKKLVLEGKAALELVEEAVHLLRRASLTTLAYYFTGSVPFVLGLLFFIADMSRSPFAYQRCAASAMGLALLFVWMRYWHTVFAGALHDQVTGLSESRWNFRAIQRTLQLQLTHSAFSFLLVPLSLLALFPYAWVYAYHQNLVVVRHDARRSIKEISRDARAFAKIWAQQNHTILTLLGLFRIVVWLNIAIFVIMAPSLLKSILGVETRFAQSYWWVANTTFITVTFGMTYLCVDPLVKAIYVLRCFYGAAIQTGEDLATDLRQAAWKRGKPIAAALVLAFMTIPGLVYPDTTEIDGPEEGIAYAVNMPEQASDHVSVEELDGILDRIMTKREYTWRMPRDLVPLEENKDSIFIRFADSIVGIIKSVMQTLESGVNAVVQWLFEGMFKSEYQQGRGSSGQAWIAALRWVIWGIIGLLVVLVGILMWRAWAGRKVVHAPSEEVATVPDLEDEQVLATQLPEEEWLALAARFHAEGEYRKAMRAYFLGGLASLGRVDIVEILRAKSNREYQRELSRSDYRYPGITSIFERTVKAFERVWYGMHSVTDADLKGYAESIELLRGRLEK